MDAEARIAKLEDTIGELNNRLGMLEDVNAVRRLQYTYGYLIDKCMYAETVDLFAEDGEVRFMGGIYKGKEGVRRLYIGRFRKNFTNDYNGPVFGFLLDHPQLQMVIDVAPDRKTAKARCRASGGKAASTKTSMCARATSGRSRSSITIRSGTAISIRAGRTRRRT